ncbi:BsuPI-related putative proteinase inhibitor [Fredinandcohnia sp. 179-A 10B2 NHS]|uniref:BsuPI-related putative proteinase inhibitor n=1 Tax=Fredinandcohnia sp. 179-A 10B2 NHS TaxID=3235176 RepID=UPI0039A29B45
MNVKSKRPIFIAVTVFIIVFIGAYFFQSNNNGNSEEARGVSGTVQPNQNNTEGIGKGGESKVEKNQSQKRQEFNPTSKKAEKRVKLVTLESNLEVVSITNGTVQLRFTSKNIAQTDLTLTYSTSQKYEYELLNKADGTITRYSDGKSFLQVIKEETIAPNEVLSHEVRLSNLSIGDYSFSMWLTFAGGIQTKKTIDFKIE